MSDTIEKPSIILFLDDDESRTKAFRRWVPRARTAVDVKGIIELIEQSVKDGETIKHLFLDHDLGGETYVESGREDCGMEVVRYLCKNNLIHHIVETIVHSHNEPAANDMLFSLWDAGYRAKRIPFIHLLSALEKGTHI